MNNRQQEKEKAVRRGQGGKYGRTILEGVLEKETIGRHGTIKRREEKKKCYNNTRREYISNQQKVKIEVMSGRMKKAKVTR